jgi:hypothetical protein
MTETASDVAKKLVGTWNYVGTLRDGKPRDRGGNPKGLIIYTETGHMAVQIAPDRKRTKAGPEPTPDEAKHALELYVAYFGTFSIDVPAATLTHHRWASVQPGDRMEVQRVYRFEGDRLILRAPGTTQETVWVRVG